MLLPCLKLRAQISSVPVMEHLWTVPWTLLALSSICFCTMSHLIPFLKPGNVPRLLSESPYCFKISCHRGCLALAACCKATVCQAALAASPSPRHGETTWCCLMYVVTRWAVRWVLLWEMWAVLTMMVVGLIVWWDWVEVGLLLSPWESIPAIDCFLAWV